MYCGGSYVRISEFLQQVSFFFDVLRNGLQIETCTNKIAHLPSVGARKFRGESGMKCVCSRQFLFLDLPAKYTEINL